MEKEISNGAMLGIVLIALAAIIGLGFGVFSIAKSTANDGVTNVQENLGAVGASSFTDYDQKIVTGTQVVSAMQSFEGKPYAILVATQATKDKSGSTAHSFDTGAGVMDAYGTKDKIPVVDAMKDKASPMKVKDSEGLDVNLRFIGYNALLNDKSSKTTIVFDANCWRASDGFLTDAGKIKMNGITKNVSKSGMMEYIPSGSRFQGYLVKDLSGTIMGIAFEQINNK